MDISFNPHLEKAWSSFGIARDVVAAAVRQPAAVVDLSPSEADRRILLYSGPANLLTACRVLVVAETSPAGYEVLLALGIPNNLVQLAGSNDPLIWIRLLAEKFGQPFRLFSDVTSFAQRTEYPFPEDGQDKPFISGPPDDSTSILLIPIYQILGRGPERRMFIMLALCLELDRYHEALGLAPLVESTDGPTIYIADDLKGQISPRALISHAGVLMLELKSVDRAATVPIFGLKFGAYLLEAGINAGSVFIRRNEYCLEQPLTVGQRTLIFLQWLPRALTLDIRRKRLTSEPNPDGYKALETGLVTPPFGLIEWARKQSIAPVTAYKTEGDFFATVSDALGAAEEKIAETSMYPAFWDYDRQSGKIVGRKPKREPDIQPTIQALLSDIALAKYFDIDREASTAGGALDFLFRGSSESGRRFSVCAEFKLAHSSDLAHGISTQLPAYMRSRACSFGIYVVLYFRGSDFDKPTMTEIDLRMALEQHRIATGLNISICVWNLCRPLPPSKR